VSRISHNESIESRGNIICAPGGFLDLTLDYLSVIAEKEKAPVLLLGPTGTGKELLAKWLVDQSPRKDMTYEQINCAGLPEDLIESELFGHKKGTFTGATEDTDGLFIKCDRGTLLLDELAVMTPQLQSKLLRVMENGKVRRLGDPKEKPVDVRIIAATSLDEGGHRKLIPDLVNRFTHKIDIPPLYKRPADIPYLIHYYASGHPFEAIDLGALFHFVLIKMEGNVRELKNLIEESSAWRKVLLNKEVFSPGNNLVSVLTPNYFQKVGRSDTSIIRLYHRLLVDTDFPKVVKTKFPRIMEIKGSMPFQRWSRPSNRHLALELNDEFPVLAGKILESFKDLLADHETENHIEKLLKERKGDKLFVRGSALGGDLYVIRVRIDDLQGLRKLRWGDIIDLPKKEAMERFERVYFEKFEAANSHLTIAQRAEKMGLKRQSYSELRKRMTKASSPNTGNDPMSG